jgi:hypothetical protein
MNRPTPTALFTAVLILIVLTAGCGEKKTESGLPPEAKKRFGYVGMPMPPEARAAMQKSQGKAGAPPVPGAPPGPAGAAPK